MKILSIKLKNLASIGEAFIDFTEEPLASAGVFAITGATGAGKSTLLDAICLALYGKTPRYDLAKESGVELKDASGSTLSQGDVKSILMDGTATGFAEVTFLALDKQIYRAEWQVKRAREKITGRLQADSIQLYNISTNTAFPERKTETLAEIEKLVGLNFHQFTRSVLLAQGDFTAFLKADKDSKASLLEKLTGTEIYSEISMAVFNKCREATQELRNLTLQMEGVEILPEETVIALLKEKEKIESFLEKTSRELKNIENEVQWYQTFEELQIQKQSAEETVKTTEENLKAHEAGRSELTLTEDVQVLKPQFIQRERIIAALEKCNKEKDSLAQTIGQLQNAIGQKGTIIQLNEQDIAGKKRQQKDYQPKFAEARHLDTLLQEKEKQASNAQDQHKLAIQRKKKQEKTLADTQKEINNLTDKITQLEAWCEKNAAGKLPAENISLIQSKLKDGESILASLETDSKNLEDSATKLKNANQQFVQLKENVDLNKISLAEGNTKVQELEDKINGLSLTGLSAKRDVLNEENNLLLNARSLWTQMCREKETLNKLIEKSGQLTLQLEESEQQLLNLEKLLHDAKIKKEHSENILVKSRLKSAENVASLRAQLIEGEECPVCGSLEHPFTLHNPQLDAVMENLEKEAQLHNGEYETILKKKSGLESFIRNGKEQSGELRKENKRQIDVLNTLDTNWKNLPLEKDCFSLPETEISSWLDNKKILVGNRLVKLKNEIDFFTETKEKLNKEEEKRKKDDDTSKEMDKKLTDVEWQIKVLEKSKAQAEESFRKNQAQMDDIIRKLTPFFSKPDWLEKWKMAPKEFTEKLLHFSQNWVTKNEELKGFKEAFNPLIAKALEINNQFAEIQSEEEKKSWELYSILDEKKILQSKRSKLFEGQDVNTVEEQIQCELDSVLQKNEENKQEQLALKNKLLTHETEFKSTANTIEKEQAELVNIQDSIEKWLTNYNEISPIKLTLVELEKIAVRDIHWIKEQREFFQKLNESVVQARSVLQDKNNMLTKHQTAHKPGRPLQLLQQNFDELNQNREQSNQRKGEIGHILQQQTNNNKRFELLRNQLEKNRKESENWNKLSDLIGSQDGKKFRRIAQEYTLDILIVHANHHLEFLSRRYVLSRIPDTLALQICDREMGDEIRTVFSLSGGESFLISLALALGLASLSSEKMQVESLFIDEGFGSLDPETLDMAMDALDRLHSQGRKVGVISHVQEMKERITTQIQVEKMSSGKSRVVVVS